MSHILIRFDITRLRFAWGKTSLISWLLMAWLLASPRHQHLCYGIHRMNASQTSTIRSSVACVISVPEMIQTHHNDVTVDSIASQIISLTIVYSVVYSGADQRKHQSTASLAFVWGIHRGPVNSPHKWPVTRKMFPFDDVIMANICCLCFLK